MDNFENNLEGKNKRNTSLNSLSKELREKYYKNKIKPRMIVGAINILKLYFPDHYTSRAAIFEEYLKSISSFDQKTIFEKKQIAYLFSKQLKIVITEIINPLAIG